MILRATLPIAGLVCAAALGPSSMVAPRAQPADDTERRSVWDGVYTVEQAKRGEQQYDEQCASCHQFGLEGDGLDIPGLADGRFRDKWDGRSLERLFDLIATSMPQQAPGTLTPAQYADTVAYILQKNDFPAGERALAAEPASLAAIVFEETRDAPR